MPPFRSVALSVLVTVAATACGVTSSPGEGALDASAAAPSTAPAPMAVTPVPTTAPVLDPGPAAPTPIMLSGGSGIQVPTAVLEPTPPEGEATPSAEAAAGGPSSPADPTVEPTTRSATSGPEPSAVESTPAPPPAVTTAPQPVDSTDPVVAVANGAEVYTLNCARCHGDNGMGSFQAGGLFGVGGRYGTGPLVDELTTGHPYTFGFGDELSPAEISDVVAYVRATFG